MQANLFAGGRKLPQVPTHRPASPRWKPKCTNFKGRWPLLLEGQPSRHTIRPEPRNQGARVSSPPKRSWGTEQALGPPDTERAGDIPTAWASREPDGGAEWLAVAFDHAVDVAEVRVRETYNPGAISKVTAIVNGQEVLLWEGTATGGEAPRDFVVPVTSNVQAQSVVVHLDTGRVSGWNQIDAVELVGRDGSRQWATSVNASSTYAEPVPGTSRSSTVQ